MITNTCAFDVPTQNTRVQYYAHTHVHVCNMYIYTKHTHTHTHTQSDPQLQPVNLLESRNILPPAPITPPKIVLPGGLGAFNPNPDVMCSTINAIPATGSLLGKLKLPLAIHIHPYRDLNTHVCTVHVHVYMCIVFVNVHDIQVYSIC